MESFAVGQRWVSEPEPELGLGLVTSVDGRRVGVAFPAAGEQRLYAADAAALKRARFRPGERISGKDGQTLEVERVSEEGGLLVYSGGGAALREDELADATSFSNPQDRLMGGQADPGELFDLRLDTLRMENRLRTSPWRGFLGGRVELIPHQMYILKEVSSRQIPRVLLADEVGLGKTIEACLIMQRLIAVGRAERILVVVPESLEHQWFVELLRRFNLKFSIFDEERCQATLRGDPEANPFHDEQFVLCSLDFLARDPERGGQAVEAGWDLVAIDEAHHLHWTPEGSSPEYDLAAGLGRSAEGLLLLTATPTQLGLEGHFARLRLLDPDRYSDLEAFRREQEAYVEVARAADKILEGKRLESQDEASLAAIFERDRDRLQARLKAIRAGRPDARQDLLRDLLDVHGPGRVIFRNTRAAMPGFPRRRYCPAPLDAGGGGEELLERLARELEAQAGRAPEPGSYPLDDDPRVGWLSDFLKARKDAKTLLICSSRAKAMALEAALRQRINARVGLFHEELSLVQRDRNAAWFAEPGGAQLLICSEIGSEGRNFQFARHLVLFDLPLNPGLLEQRIGRLDRIGQKAEVHIHVPYVVGSCQECLADWYHEGLNAFESCLHGGTEYLSVFGERLLELALAYGDPANCGGRSALEALVEETEAYRERLDKKLRRGRDRLLELNSYDAEEARAVVEAVRREEADPAFRSFLCGLLDAFGVRVEEHDAGDVFLDPSHAFVEDFPSLPREGMLATFDRRRAIEREDIAFVSSDHPLAGDAIDFLLSSERGTAAFAVVEGEEANLLLEAVYCLEPVSPPKLHVDRFMAQTPLRVAVDARGRARGGDWPVERIRRDGRDGELGRFLERAGLNREFFDAMLAGAEAVAREERRKLVARAKAECRERLGDEIERLEALIRLNDTVRPEEIEAARAELKGALAAIEAARLRLDALRLIELRQSEQRDGIGK